MYDLATDSDCIKLIREFHDEGRIVTALCHGVAALVNVKLADGSSILAGERVTGFSDKEEEEATATNRAPPNMPFDLQKALDKASGGKYEKATDAWAPHVIVNPSKKLLFGQNPASAHPLAVELWKVLNGSK